jgi:hypothetical protein
MPFDLRIGIDEAHIQLSRQLLADGGLATARHADKRKN